MKFARKNAWSFLCCILHFTTPSIFIIFSCSMNRKTYFSTSILHFIINQHLYTNDLVLGASSCSSRHLRALHLLPQAKGRNQKVHSHFQKSWLFCLLTKVQLFRNFFRKWLGKRNWKSQRCSLYGKHSLSPRRLSDR